MSEEKHLLFSKQEWIARGFDRNEWNNETSRRAHLGKKSPCPHCSALTRDYKTYLFTDDGIWCGACNECDRLQTREVHKYMRGE
jgi:hypothetical protein